MAKLLGLLVASVGATTPHARSAGENMNGDYTIANGLYVSSLSRFHHGVRR
jgi:hypothetical protein